MNSSVETFQKLLLSVCPAVIEGRVIDICGPVLRASFIGAAVGDVVEVNCRAGSGTSQAVRAQVVSCSSKSVTLSPLERLDGIYPGAKVTYVSQSPRIRIGRFLLGSVVDALGNHLATLAPAPENLSGQTEIASIHNSSPSPLRRAPIENIFSTGIRAIDTFVTLGEGQRIGIFAEPGVGKSSLIRTIIESSSAEVNVLALIGERGREVAELVHAVQNTKRAANLVVVTSTSDEPPLRRIAAAHTATRIAEHFRAEGRRVLLQIDSMTRLFRAYREVGLAAGEMPVRRGYPPSVFSQLPQLIERAGTGPTGSITALYTVLLSSDLDEDPMVEELKGLTDGHLILRKSLAEAGHYPAIDVVNSLSRLASSLLDKDTNAAVRKARRLLARLQTDKDLLALGGEADSELQEALRLWPALENFLRQDQTQQCSLEETLADFRQILSSAC